MNTDITDRMEQTLSKFNTHIIVGFNVDSDDQEERTQAMHAMTKRVQELFMQPPAQVAFISGYHEDVPGWVES